jgi:hypothetical protein
MFSISALGKNVTLEPDSKKDAAPKINFPVPKSEGNLESSFVFPNAGSKEIDRPSPQKHPAREDATIPEVE